MEKLTDWSKLWADLSDLQNRAFNFKKKDTGEDAWKDKAKKFDKMVDERWRKKDTSRDFLVDLLKKDKNATVIDIGAGTGKWALHIAPFAKKVTAFEPSQAMQDVLRKKLAGNGITNIEIVTGSWPDDPVEPHDYVLASHSMYGVADFKGFVEKMNQTAQKGCIMVLRAPYANAMMAAAAKRILGQPYDSPNFQIAYNLLLGMDIYPDVIMEAEGGWPPWKNDSFEQALDEIKNRLGIKEKNANDVFLTSLLKKNLVKTGNGVEWPSGSRSALVYWKVQP